MKTIIFFLFSMVLFCAAVYSQSLYIGAHFGRNSAADLPVAGASLTYCRGKYFIGSIIDSYWSHPDIPAARDTSGAYPQTGLTSGLNEISELFLGLRLGRELYKWRNFSLTALADIGATYSEVDFTTATQNSPTSPVVTNPSYMNKATFCSFKPSIGIFYNVPKTTMCVGIKSIFSHHFNYWDSPDWSGDNDYFSTVVSLTFDVLK